ncbi:hypothetical protein HKK52_29705 [Pseudomonas sp. ADAK2]|uniref:hypothetical protein n=1 Tax=unclassified Pseudomonas TaxID=196821 RepID=UPI0014648548|nr:MULTISPECIES: hypothetical protein [unclassified Pseudomonas]QJI44961.1 hypothetical protein HKK53_29705 [Pseudomonas sp. ADAK7]QJI51262.1 hypothetical protein HKK52_29705 [Pseudomonas sp. ADAK2]
MTGTDQKKIEIALLFVVLGLTTAIIVLAVVGALTNYSPVPFWDMWNGYLEFYTKLTSGDISAIWAQHNEHRVIISHLLFWFDLSVFGGRGGFLIACNYILVSMSAYIFCRWLSLNSGGTNKTINTLACSLLCAWLFFWCQENNLTWGFQSQFFLAQLLPLCSFFWCYKTHTSDKPNIAFAIACLFGVVSAGTMANGIVALPLMFFYAIATKISLKRTAVLALLSITTLSLYFTNYHSVIGHGSLQETIKTNPIGLIHFILLYVGSPFHYFTESGSILGATLAGLILILSTFYYFCSSILKRDKVPSQLALVFFIIYIGATAFGTAGGRLLFGLESAFSSRYTTPALMAWAALFLLAYPLLSKYANRFKVTALIGTSLFILAMLPQQMKALQSPDDKKFNQEVAALALDLRIEDQLQIGVIFPSAKWALSISAIPVQQQLSVFGLSYMKGLYEQLGSSSHHSNSPVCIGAIDESASFEEPGYVRVRGWMFDPASQHSPKKLTFIDSSDKIVGFALSGQPRDDVANAISPNAKKSGFKGYIKSSQRGFPVTILGDDGVCILSALTPQTPFTVSTVSQEDYLPETLAGFSQLKRSQPYSTIIGPDTTITVKSPKDVLLTLKRGQSIYYRSSALTSGLNFKLPLDQGYSFTLPLSMEWTQLIFDNPSLPDIFDLELINQEPSDTTWFEIKLKDK